jgi:hypothetical protein
MLVLVTINIRDVLPKNVPFWCIEYAHVVEQHIGKTVETSGFEIVNVRIVKGIYKWGQTVQPALVGKRSVMVSRHKHKRTEGGDTGKEV